MVPRILAVLIAAACLPAQQVRTPAVRQALVELLAPEAISVPPEPRGKARQARGVPEGVVILRVRWGQPFQILEKRRGPGSVPSLRAVRLRPGVLFLAAIDCERRLLSWQIVPDPRVVRAEAPGPGGEITGRTLRVENPEFTVEAPADPAAAELRIFEPRWTGKRYELDLAGTVSLK